MARVKKGDASKAKRGAAKNYITRTQAVRRLQISLPDFRRLCIFKGIYPREPRNKKKVQKGATPATTFYYTKDIQYLQHEPLLNKFREHNTLAKKIGRALGRNEVSDAARLERNRPRMTLNHLVKERYPSFVDALRDMDDALSMLFLFSTLPSMTHVPAKTIALCQRLCLEFQHYVIVSRSLRKSFLSIKGIYYQATIQGQDIMWLVPYKFVQTMAGDIDFRIMITFIEFYTTLIGFINYRLYTTIGLVYPPKFDSASDARGGELGAIILEGKGSREISEKPNGHAKPTTASAATQAEADKVALLQEIEAGEDEGYENENANDGTIDNFEPVTTGADILLQPEVPDSDLNALFSKCTVYLSRETPKAALEFILKAFGCSRVGWDLVLGDGAFTTDEKDPRITHQVVDRPRVIVQHSENDIDYESSPQAPLRVPGRTYVQPQWVWDSINQGKLLRSDLYAPGASLPPHLSPWVKPAAGVYDPTAPLPEQEKEDDDEIDDVEHSEGVEEDKESEEENEKRKGQEQVDRQRMMMSTRKRKLFDKMQYGNQKRQAEAEKLREKRRKIEKKLLVQSNSA